ncbi:MAG: DUF1499 domain-containing protein [Nitrospirota bacterium]
MTAVQKIGAWVAPAGLGVAVAALAALALAGLGTRMGWWHFRAGFTLLFAGAVGGLAAAAVSATVLALTWLWPPDRAVLHRGMALAGIVIGVLAAAIPWQWKQAAQRVPPIHDITTDTEQPPEFVAILPLRADAPNPADYGGPDIAAQQRTAYPDLQPLPLPQPPEAAFTAALDVARRIGWEIVAAEPAEGRIEATDTTFWFGFTDDIVVRIRPAAEGSRIDVRSVSRVGRSDVGTNARRIRAYLKTLAGAA